MAPVAQDESTSSSSDRPVVLLTGYGLFREYSSNSSKEVVDRIAATGIEGIDLRTEILPVVYDSVKKRTQELHEQCKPCVTIHCGMYSEANAVILEQVARNTGYDVADVNGDVVCNNCCVEQAPEFLKTCFDLEEIAGNCKTEVPVYISRDAGLYLCEYIYYLALNRCQKSLFIHIPALSDVFPLDKVVEAVKRIIILTVQQSRQGTTEASS
ncbi:pyroglutamyl-peptidase 1 [Galendromus occidentalis]|uniref:Pyroglutamyl-peptidase 1 n=1 Tax=Galendromus occidentalis TaxID=34638 RepID=A0AAJ6QYX3_9ACAR|nr:pyroglutamyl-peptidase 1 [Galendromus occidentalis]